MKVWHVLMIVALVAMLAACGQQPQNNTEVEEQVVEAATEMGQPITLEQAVSIDTMMAAPEAYLGQTVMIEGKVMGRCSGSGCWISIDRGPETAGLIVQAEDKSFIFPENCVGKEVAIQGILKLQNPEAMAEHEKEVEEADHVCPNPEYFFEPTGLKIKA